MTLSPSRGTAAPPPATARASTEDVATSIRELATLDEAGIGFSPSVTGAQFLPAPDSDEQGMMLLGQPPPKRSPALLRLVAAGATAMPALLACLDDATPTKLPPMKAMMWTGHDDEYDFNRRTRTPPAGVNRTGSPAAVVPHVVTVGDLCFVALGQIVNRAFAAVRYQPTGGLMINSPPSSPPLRDAVRAEWAGVDAAALRASLVRDFTEPDSEARRIGAVIRLRFYFPDALAPVLRADLARPTFDSDDVRAQVRTLYGLAGAARAKAFRAFLGRHGPAEQAAVRDGVLRSLFEDLEGQEAYEQKRVSPPTSGRDYRARECLVELFGYPASVTSKDAPFPQYANQYERERLIKIRR